MRIVVFGAGGVGGFFGGKLVQAGHDVTFVARGKHLDAIQQRGLQVKSINGDFKVEANAVESLDGHQSADLVLISVKSLQLEDAAEAIKPVMNRDTSVLPLLNGANIADRLSEIIPPGQVVAGLCRIVSRIESPGVIDHFAFKKPEIIFGLYDGRTNARLKMIKSMFDAAGIDNKLSTNIRLDIWKKFLFITMVSGMGALTRSTFGLMREDEHIRSLIYQTASEIVSIANNMGIGLDNTDIEKSFKAIDGTLYDTTASMQRDIMAGRPSELDNFNGYIVQMGKELHLNTPVNSLIYHCLFPQEKRARELSSQ
ncbi:MAG: 2-dehydropantoate 2-reductase [Flavobacteriaceae bacterium]|nr:2-dehydropantoate 2-reductase [Flavobacteriaceae bacterium]